MPAREQLAELLLELHRASDALREFKTALLLAPGRRAALIGAITAAQETGDLETANRLRLQLAEQTHVR